MRDVTISTLAEAVAALTEGGPVRLRSQPFASASLGAGAFLALIKAARAAMPGVKAEAVLDCGDAPGHALGALRLGAEAISLTASDEVMQKIAEIAAQTGAKLYRASPDGQLHAMLPASSTHP